MGDLLADWMQVWDKSRSLVSATIAGPLATHPIYSIAIYVVNQGNPSADPRIPDDEWLTVIRLDGPVGRVLGITMSKSAGCSAATFATTDADDKLLEEFPNAVRVRRMVLPPPPAQNPTLRDYLKFLRDDGRGLLQYRIISAPPTHPAYWHYAILDMWCEELERMKPGSLALCRVEEMGENKVTTTINRTNPQQHLAPNWYRAAVETSPGSFLPSKSDNLHRK